MINRKIFCKSGPWSIKHCHQHPESQTRVNKGQQCWNCYIGHRCIGKRLTEDCITPSTVRFWKCISVTNWWLIEMLCFMSSITVYLAKQQTHNIIQTLLFISSMKTFWPQKMLQLTANVPDKVNTSVQSVTNSFVWHKSN